MADTEDTTYAPQSPDLTAVDQFEPHPQHREYRGSVSHISPFTPTAELKSPFGFPPSAHAAFPPQVTQPPSQQPPPLLQQQQFFNTNQQQFAPPPPHLPSQPQPNYNPYFAGVVPQQPQYPGSIPPQQVYSQHQYPVQVKQEDGYFQGFDPSGAMAAARGGKKAKKEEDAELENNAPGVKEGIEVRTKFPVARIKRIMQADEDVGKVAQVTPVAVSKALELFMISLVTKAATQARERGSKRVLAAHLKQAVLDDDQFDYLQEIVSKVAEAPSKNADKNEDSDEGMEGVAAAPKKKRAAGGGRKRRKNSDDEF